MNRLFRSLGEKLRPQTQPLYRLSDREYKQLSHLIKQDEWKVYLRLLDRHAQVLGEHLLYAPREEVLERRGQIKGLSS